MNGELRPIDHVGPRAGLAPRCLLLNIAIGGTLGGAVDDSIFPRTMEAEHVRVWQAGS